MLIISLSERREIIHLHEYVTNWCALKQSTHSPISSQRQYHLTRNTHLDSWQGTADGSPLHNKIP